MVATVPVHGVCKIVEQVKMSNKNGYIWHTTGSGKTLTSFKVGQILSQMDEVRKVLLWWTEGFGYSDDQGI